MPSVEIVRGSNRESIARGDGVYVLVAAPRQVAQHECIARQFARELRRLREGVAGFERGEDALGARELVEGGERFVVGHADVRCAAAVLQERRVGKEWRT